MSIRGQGHSFTLVKVHSDFKVKCLTFGLYTQVSDSGPLGPLVLFSGSRERRPYFFENQNKNKSDFNLFYFYFFRRSQFSTTKQNKS